jgi:hypothetical protein
MKRFPLLAAACIIALPMVAEEPKTEAKQKSEPAKAADQVKSEPARPEQVPDSPLVAAAKSANRAGKKRIVITNDDLKKTGGHITTTNIKSTVNVPTPLPSAEEFLYQQAKKQRTEAAEKAEKDRLAAEAEKKRIEGRAAMAAEGSLYDESDPAEAEKKEQEARQPQSSEKKP